MVTGFPSLFLYNFPGRPLRLIPVRRIQADLRHIPGKDCVFSLLQGSHAVLNCEIGFQDLEKVLNLLKTYIKY